MTKKHLYPTPFNTWPGWDYLKWVLGVAILAAILWVIWCHNIGKEPIENLPAWVEAAINAIDQKK